MQKGQRKATHISLSLSLSLSLSRSHTHTHTDFFCGKYDPINVFCIGLYAYRDMLKLIKSVLHFNYYFFTQTNKKTNKR